MSTFTMPLSDFLKQFMTNDFDEPNPTGVKNNNRQGDWYHMNEVIDKTFNRPFENMRLQTVVASAIDEEFKRAFCVRYYDREIGFDVWAPFEAYVENILNTECFNLFKFRDAIKNMTPDKWNQTGKTTTNTSGDSKNLGIQNTSPKDDLSIIYPGVPGDIIKYADALAEQYGNSVQSGESTTANTRPMFEQLTYNALLPSIDDLILNKLNKAFLQIWSG